ncbi:hypothetical protein [Gimesia fumaroli]|uniref:Uncharacterized protein n=1 Tax=Gimesia fumaroli TaxID=2527976 RepID=A0A518IAE6_9PLAN|nr:hypothetical protein [Gimesia fumaroli]QDV50078.1 hypothetical protein Enr17x_21140 [Gimesia fumaroli]
MPGKQKRNRLLDLMRIFAGLAFCLVFTHAGFAESQSTASVGMSARIEEVILPGSELQVKEIADGDPIILRIISTHPHGPDMFRYELEYYGLQPGEYNLADFLERKDGTPLGEVSAVPVQVESILAADRVEPNSPDAVSIPRIGGYRLWMTLIFVMWVLGIFLIVFARRKAAAEGEEDEQPPPTLSERLQPMVEKAISGELSNSQMAELEMMLVAFWRKRLHLEQTDVAEVTQILKQHKEAGPLLQQLEILLHRPDASQEVNVAQMLEPYQDLPAEALDEELAALAS